MVYSARKLPLTGIFRPRSKRSHYCYSPLNEDLKDIRLITLHPGDSTANLEISIQTVSLMPESPPIYEALSYAWGSAKSMTSIRIGEDSLAVTKSLANALRHLRYSEDSRALWIDAICINQQNLTERSHQVKRMADIYSLADRVVAWLGPARDQSGWGMKIIEHLGSQIEVDWELLEMKTASRESEPHWSEKFNDLPFGNEEQEAITDILSRPWFERLWVKQEIRLANCHAIVMSGFDTIIGQEEPEESMIQNSTTYSSALDFFQVMQHTHQCKCGDPRDRIDAILSLIKESGLVEPDYRKTIRQVYQDVTIRYIARTESMDILRFSGLEGNRSKMPTWVPTWSVRDKGTLFIIRKASGGTLPKVQFKGPDTLNVTGLCLAIVQQIENLGGKTNEKVVANIRKAAPDDILGSSYVGGGSLLAAYCHTICANNHAETSIPHYNGWPRIQQSLDLLSAILQPGKQRATEHQPGAETNTYLNMVQYYTRTHSFIKTREGYMGLVPLETRAGDHVCILLGCPSPMLLRPAPNNQFLVVRECYVHGLMTGEAFLGPLPDHYQLVQVADQTQPKSFLPFYNHRTGKFQFNDPRLETLPPDEVNPILTPEMIEKRGVKLRTFDLI